VLLRIVASTAAIVELLRADWSGGIQRCSGLGGFCHRIGAAMATASSTASPTAVEDPRVNRKAAQFSRWHLALRNSCQLGKACGRVE